MAAAGRCEGRPHTQPGLARRVHGEVRVWQGRAEAHQEATRHARQPPGRARRHGAARDRILHPMRDRRHLEVHEGLPHVVRADDGRSARSAQRGLHAVARAAHRDLHYQRLQRLLVRHHRRRDLPVLADVARVRLPG